MTELDDMRDYEDMDAVGDEITTDSMLGDFRGRNVVMILIVTVIFHAVLILGTSFSFLKEKIFGVSTDGMDKEKRVAVALAEATDALGEIAERHGLEVTDITAKFGGGGSRASKVTDDTNKAKGTDPKTKPEDTTTPKKEDPKKEDPEKSTIEKKISKPLPPPPEPDDDDDDDNSGLD